MTFDKRQEFEDYIKPQLVGLKRLCIKHDLPFFFAVCVENNKDESVYESEMFSGLAKGLNLTDDYFPNLAKVMCGFETKMPYVPIDFQESEIDDSFLDELEASEDIV